MPPQLASIVTWAFVFWLFVRDVRQKPNVTGALWLPLCWFLLIATRNVSQWLAVFGLPGFGGTSVEEGSTLDAYVYLAMIIAGVCVLSTRQVRLAQFARDNQWLVIFVLYCFLAIFWADLQFIAFKRWIKVLGHPVMVLLVFTEPDPVEALKRLMKRAAYVILPISMLFIKYYPALGRRAGGWATVSANTGITTGKNMLGADCFILGLFLFWCFLQIWPAERSKARSKELYLVVALLCMNMWCLWKAHSATSWFALIGGATAIVMMSLRFIRKSFGTLAVSAVILIGVAQVSFDLFGVIAQLRGKEDTVAGRGELWHMLLQQGTNPLIGVGFESFWVGERLQKIWAMPEFNFWRPNEAHNGYLEIYLTIGSVGLLILGGVIAETYNKCRDELALNFEWGRWRLGTLIAILAYNWMEAGFRGLNPIFLVFFFVAITSTRLRVASSEEPVMVTEEVTGPRPWAAPDPAVVHDHLFEPKLKERSH